MATNKNDYWLNNVWGELPYRVPGTDGLVLPAGNDTTDRPSSPEDGHIRYNKTKERLEGWVNGNWEFIVSGDTPTILTVPDKLSIPNGPHADGDLLTVLDDGDGHELLFVWNNANPEIAGPPAIYRWRLLSTTELFASAVVYRNQVIFDEPTQDIGAGFAILFNPYVKEINVTIIDAFDPGRTIHIREAGGGTLMDTPLINPQLPGTYQLKILDSTNSDSDGIQNKYLLNNTGRIEAVVGGASSGNGRAVVYIKAVTQLEETP